MAYPQSLIPKSRSTHAAAAACAEVVVYQHPLAQPHLVREAIEPAGDALYAEAIREWIELVNLAPRRIPLHLVP